MSSATRLVVFGAVNELDAVRLVSAGVDCLYLPVAAEETSWALKLSPATSPFGLMSNPHLPPLKQVGILAPFAAEGWRCAIWTHGVDLLASREATGNGETWMQVNYWDHDDAPFFPPKRIVAAADAWNGLTLVVNFDLTTSLGTALHDARLHPEWGELTKEDLLSVCSARLTLCAAWAKSDIHCLIREGVTIGGLGFVCGRSEYSKLLPAFARSPSEVADLIQLALS